MKTTNKIITALSMVVLLVINTNNTYAFKISEHFPDPNFSQYVAEKIERDINEEIDESLISETMSLNVLGNRACDVDSLFSDLTGIKYITQMSAILIDCSAVTFIPNEFFETTYIHLDQFRLKSTEDGNGGYNKTIASVPNKFDLNKIPALDSFSLVGSTLTSIPSSLFNFTDLIIFEMPYSNITSLPNDILNLGNLGFFDFSNNAIIDISEEVYNYITGLLSYNIEQQNYIGNISNIVIGNEYTINSIPAFKQFPNYGMTFTYELYSDTDLENPIATKSLNRALDDLTVNNGVVTIKKDVINQLGDYTLVATGIGGDIQNASITLHFKVVEPTPIPPGEENKNPGNDSKLDSTDNKTLANTGNPYYIYSIISIIISIITYSIYARHRIIE